MTRSVVLLTFLGLAQVVEGIYAAKAQPIPGSFQIFYFMTFLWGTGMWLEHDNKKHRIDWVFDMGTFLYVAWPLVMPVYLFKTRGMKAYRPICVFLAVFISGLFVGYLIGRVL